MRVSVLGGAGYVGGELTRLLLAHPEVELTVCSRSHSGEPLGTVWPQFRHRPDLRFAAGDPLASAREAQIVFLAMGTGEGMSITPLLLGEGRKVIDLGPDFRFSSTAVYEEWYGRSHSCPELAARAVYGLTELLRPEIKGADLVANPGCYPTAALLALAPLLREGYVAPEGITVDAKSGLSGAGRQPAEGYQFAAAADNLRAYGIPGHRHTPEIEQGLSVFAGCPVRVTFIPHLVPMARGLFVTAVASMMRRAETAEIVEAMSVFYRGEPFVTVLRDGALPETKALWGTNRVQLTARADVRTGKVVILAALDNLGKGAAGQGIQNMNLLCGFPEETGLGGTAIYP